MQGKGGVGKSVCCALFAQYLKSRQFPFKAVDTDPANQSLMKFRELNAQFMDLLCNRDNVEVGEFDQLIDLVDTYNSGSAENLQLVVDSGSSNFIPLLSFLERQEGAKILSELGVRLMLHMPVACGDAGGECWSTFADVAGRLDAPIIIWLNNYPVEADPPEKFDGYLKHRDRISAMIRFPHFEPSVGGRIMRMVLDNNLCFSQLLDNSVTEINESPVTTVQRIRVRHCSEQLFSAISAADPVMF